MIETDSALGFTIGFCCGLGLGMVGLVVGLAGILIVEKFDEKRDK